MSKYTAEELWELACEPDIDLEIQRAIRMTDGEIRDDLICRGYDVAKLEDQARAMFGLKKPRKAKASFVAGSLVALTGLGSSITAFLVDWAPVVPAAVAAAVTASAPAPATADALRYDAYHACRYGQWETCLADLDAARDIDPDGETDTTRAARALAEARR